MQHFRTTKTQLTGFSGLTIEEGGATGMEVEPMVTLGLSFMPEKETALESDPQLMKAGQ